MNKKIKELPEEMRPYEKFMKEGPHGLSDEELLAVILRSGSKGESSLDLSRRLLLELGNGNQCLCGLRSATVNDLRQLKGIGPVKALQIKCLCELSRRMAKSGRKKGIVFDSPSAVAEYYMEDMRHEEQEMLLCVMLDSKDHFMGDEVISVGTVNSSLVSPREIFLKAMAHRAVHIILLHNHPSGCPEPSREDILASLRVRKAGELLGIQLIDHIIIGDLVYFSLCNEGLLEG